MNTTSANLYNSSVNKKLILCYEIIDIVLYCVFAQLCQQNVTYKALQSCCVSVSNIMVFNFWMNPHFDRIEWMNDS